MSKVSQLLGGGNTNTGLASPSPTPAPPSFYAPKSPYSGGAGINDAATMAAAVNNTIATSARGDTSNPLLAKQGLKALLGQ